MRAPYSTFSYYKYCDYDFLSLFFSSISIHDNRYYLRKKIDIGTYLRLQ